MFFCSSRNLGTTNQSTYPGSVPDWCWLCNFLFDSALLLKPHVRGKKKLWEKKERHKVKEEKRKTLQNCCYMCKITIHLFATVSTKCFLYKITLEPPLGCSEPARSSACVCMCMFYARVPVALRLRSCSSSIPLFSGVCHGPLK